MTGRRLWFSASLSASLLALLFAGFCGYLFGLSHFQEQHSQSTMYKNFAGQLATAVAPVAVPADGVPVAILDMPTVHLTHAVVVEGTTGADLARGPGHLAGTVLPGQDGVTVLLGRHGTFGAPFAQLAGLRVGDKIQVTTGQGVFTYQVNAYGHGAHPVQDQARDRMVLVTADSSWIPTETVYVGARLVGQPADTPGRVGAVSAAGRPLATDPSALQPLQLWSLALLIVSVLAGLGVRYWNRRAIYLVLSPVLFALVWTVYASTALYLPNLY